MLLSSGMSSWARARRRRRGRGRRRDGAPVHVRVPDAAGARRPERARASCASATAGPSASRTTRSATTPPTPPWRSAPSSIEKHFTLSKELYGPDAALALEPDELEDLVEGMREIETMLANPVDKDDLEPFAEMKRVFEKSVVAVADIPAGGDDRARDARGQEAGHGDPGGAPRRGRRPDRARRHRRRHRGHRGCCSREEDLRRRRVARELLPIKSAMRAIEAHPELELQLVVGASALLDRYGTVLDADRARRLRAGRARVHADRGRDARARWRSRPASACSSCRPSFERLQPDVVITVGDRFETMATALAATYMNIPLAHTMGGEVSGNIDESIRHAVTKFAHVHFPACTDAAERIVRLGEDPDDRARRRLPAHGSRRRGARAERRRPHADLPGRCRRHVRSRRAVRDRLAASR